MGQSGGSEAACLFPALGIASDPEPATRYSAAENAAVRIVATAASPTEKIECKRIKLSSVARALLDMYRYPAKPTERGKNYVGQSGGNEAASLFPALGIASDPEPATRFSAAENAAVRILATAA